MRLHSLVCQICHLLTWKIGMPIILRWNIISLWFCNDNRLSLKNSVSILWKLYYAYNIMEYYKNFIGGDVLFPRIPMIPTDVPFEFKRSQFLVRLAVAWPSTKHKKNHNNYVDWIWKIHVSRMDSCIWSAYVSENFPIYLFMHQKKKQKYHVSKCTSINSIQSKTLIVRFFSDFFKIRINT